MKLLTAAGIQSPPLNVLIGAAQAVFGIQQNVANDTISSLMSSGFLKYGDVVDALPTVTPQYDLYLEMAVPDYDLGGSHTPDIARLAEWFLSAYPAQQAPVKVRLGEALADRQDSATAIRCFEAALETLLRETTPALWARAQFGLGLLELRELESHADIPDVEARIQVE